MLLAFKFFVVVDFFLVYQCVNFFDSALKRTVLAVNFEEKSAAAHGSSWQLMAAHGSSWQLMVAHGGT